MDKCGRYGQGAVIRCARSIVVLCGSALVLGYSPILFASSLAANRQDELAAAIGAKKPRPRQVIAKSQYLKLDNFYRQDAIVVKFAEGSRVRQRPSGVVSLAGRSLGGFNKVLGALHSARMERLFSRSEEDLDAERESSGKLADEDLADLNLYYRIYVDKIDNPVVLLNDLNALDVVEAAYPEAIPQPAMALPYDIPPITPDWTSKQTYLDAIYARAVWSLFPGSTQGQGVKIGLIDFGVTVDHEDLRLTASDVDGQNGLDFHGTAMAGIMVAVDNSYGVTGIANQAALKFFSPSTGVADAFNRAAGKLNAGDIIVNAFQNPWSTGGKVYPGTCYNSRQFGFVATEVDGATYDAIKSATSAGRVVVLAAGNGTMSLDDSVYQRMFDRTFRDSGAIYVGAGTLAGSPECWSNYGSRIDLQSLGENVMTTGGGDPMLHFATSDPNQYYDSVFDGTSAASPIVAGAAAVVQGWCRSQRGKTLGPAGMRAFLVARGTPQYAGTESIHIGPIPKLSNMIGTDLPKPFISYGFDNFKNLTLKVGLESGCYADNTTADYWVYADYGGVRYYQDSMGNWGAAPVVRAQGNLINAYGVTVFFGALPYPKGSIIRVTFAVDLAMNGIMDGTKYSASTNIVVP